MTADLGGRVALVTGGGNGIGRATAMAFGARDASVVVADVDETAAAETAELIGAGARTAVVRADVADPASVERMVAFAVERFGALDFACNVAGVSGEQKPFTDHTLAEWQRVINIDLTGVFLCMQHELRQMVTQGRGAIVNVSSAAGVVPAPGQPQYTAAKHGVLGLTKQAAQEYARAGIRVNAVLPGQTETAPMRAYLDAQPDHGERMLRGLPAGRMATPGEIAESIVWLCSDAASYVNGVSLLVDGGLIAMKTVDFNPYSHDFHDDPFPIYRELRDHAPCYYNEPLDFWALSRYDDVLAALHDPATYCSRFGITLEQQNTLPMLLTTDPPDHTDLRRLVSRAFTPRRVADLEPAVRALSNGFLDPLLAKGDGDLVADYAAQLPMDVIARMLGVPHDDQESLRVWTNALLDRDEGVPDVTPAGIDAAINLVKYFSRFVEERRAAIASGHTPDDLTTALCTAASGDALTNEQVVGFCFLLIIAGNETTTKLLANCLLALQRFPSQRAKIVSDPTRIPDAVEEILRFEGSTQLMARTLTRPVDLHGERMPSGAKVLLLLGSANRDERTWDRPDVFDIDRGSAVQHVGFGHGIHVCLGAALARLEMRVSLEEIFRRLPDYEIDEAGCARVHSGNVRGWASVPIRCHP